MKMRASRGAAVAVLAAAVLMAGLEDPAEAEGKGGSLTGRVTDEQGARLQGVTVTVSASGRKRNLTTITNANGELRFLSLPPGKYKVKIQMEGFRTLVREVVVEAGQAIDLSVELPQAEAVEETVVESDIPAVIDSRRDQGPARATVFQRQRADGSNSLGIGLDGVAIDRLDTGLSSKLGRQVDLGSMPSGWQYDPANGYVSGPPSVGVHLRFDAPSRVELPSRLKLEASLDGERVFGGKVDVGQMPPVDPSAAPDLSMPAVITPGEWFFFTTPAGERVRLDYGGDLGEYPAWPAGSTGGQPGGELVAEVLGGVTVPQWFSDVNGEPFFSVAPVRELIGPVNVVGIDEYNEVLFSTPWEPTVVPAGLYTGRQFINGASDLTFAGQEICVCGAFDDPSALDRLQIGGNPLGPPTGVSPYVATFDTPAHLTPGPWSVGWSADFTAGLGGPVETEVIEIRASINDELIQRQETTGLEMDVVGTDKAVYVELENKSPGKITMTPADSIETRSTGGPGRNHVPGIEVTGKVPGTYSIDWTVKAGTCPCEETLPVVAEHVLAVKEGFNTLFNEALKTVNWALDDPGTDSDPEDADCSGALPLGNGRFSVALTAQGPDKPGSLSCVQSGQDMAGILFNAPGSLPKNLEVLVKVLDGCQFNGHYWVFAAAATDVEYTLTVTDTVTGDSRSYGNDLGQPAPAVIDTAAFDTCP